MKKQLSDKRLVITVEVLEHSVVLRNNEKRITTALQSANPGEAAKAILHLIDGARLGGVDWVYVRVAVK